MRTNVLLRSPAIFSYLQTLQGGCMQFFWRDFCSSEQNWDVLLYRKIFETISKSVIPITLAPTDTSIRHAVKY
jgi:hypothetical protein